jgi:hypothetical protein
MHNRSAQSDELPEFELEDNIAFDNLNTIIASKFADIATYLATAECGIIQSKQYEGGIPRFALKVTPELDYTAYHIGMQCTIATLSKNRISTICKVSVLEEAVRFLRTREVTEEYS